MVFGGVLPPVAIGGMMTPVDAAGAVVTSGAVLAPVVLVVLLVAPSELPVLGADDAAPAPAAGAVLGALVVVVLPEAPKAKFGTDRAQTTPTAKMNIAKGSETTSFTLRTQAPQNAALPDLLPLLLAVAPRGIARSFVR